MKRTLLTLIAVLLMSGAAQAAVLDMGHHEVEAGGTAYICVSLDTEGEICGGASFYFSIEAGGPTFTGNSMLGAETLPDWDIVPGASPGDTSYFGIDSQGNDRVLDGIVLCVEIDTTGLEPCDTYEFYGEGWGIPSDVYYDVGGPMPFSYITGTIHITPEPGTISLLVMGAAGVLLRRRRK